MPQTIKKTADGYEFTIPEGQAGSLRIREGMQYEYEIIDNVIIFKLKSRAERLKEFLMEIKDDRLHDEYLADEPREEELL